MTGLPSIPQYSATEQLSKHHKIPWLTPLTPDTRSARLLTRQGTFIVIHSSLRLKFADLNYSQGLNNVFTNKEEIKIFWSKYFSVTFCDRQVLDWPLQEFFLGIKYNLKVYIRGTLSTAYHNCLGRVHDHSLINSKFCNFNYNRCDIEKSKTVMLTARVAQWIRRRSPKPKIGGSSPPVGNQSFGRQFSLTFRWSQLAARK